MNLTKINFEKINLERMTNNDLDWILKFIMGRPLSGRGLDEAKARGWKIITDKNGKQYLDDKDRAARIQERKDYKEKIKKARSEAGAQEKGRLGKAFKDQVWAKMKEMGGGNLREPATRGDPKAPRLKKKTTEDLEPAGKQISEQKTEPKQTAESGKELGKETKEPGKEKKTRKKKPERLGRKKLSKSAKAKALKEITNLFREKNKLGKSGKIPKELQKSLKEFKRGYKTSEVQAKKQGKEGIRKSREALGFKPTGNLKSYEKQILQGHSAGKITTEDAIAQLAKRRGEAPEKKTVKKVAKKRIEKKLGKAENPEQKTEKNPETEQKQEPKKRGRPKKVKEETKEKAEQKPEPKKRGRPKKIDKEKLADSIAARLKKELGE